ncbi:MAG TPA: SDR family oxidoreductase [Bacteroidia bacterium]|nr:SDR family oxidoreductase [Bacteroidia bacterium]
MKNDQSTIFHIVVLGANGGIGRQAVEIALQQGHHVTAILRNPMNLSIVHPNLLVIKGDIMNPEGLEKHLENKDAVLSAIGKTSFKKTTLYSQGNKNLLNLMKKAGISRVFFISASGLEVNPSHTFLVRFATKYILQKLLKNMYADLERMERIIKESPLNWTIMRPPQLTDAALTGQYRFSVDKFLKEGLKISRADLAHFMLGNITNELIYKTTVEVAY